MDKGKEIKGIMLYGKPGKGNTYRIFTVDGAQATRPSVIVERRKKIFQAIEELKGVKPAILKIPEIDEIADW